MKSFLLSALCSLLLASGCQTQNAPGRMLASTVQTVDAAMQGWWTFEALGHAKPDQIATVRKAYAVYQAAESAAEVAYVISTKTGDTSGWSKAAEALRESQAILLELLELFQTAKENQ